jgi:hypothetical protein
MCKSIFTLEKRVMVHFKAWLKVAYKKEYRQVEGLPILFLNSIKPLRLLEKGLIDDGQMDQ